MLSYHLSKIFLSLVTLQPKILINISPIHQITHRYLITVCLNFLQVAGIKVTLNEYRDQLEKAVTKQDFVMAANYKEKITEQETLLNAELDHTINSTNTTIAAANISIIVR